MLISTDPSYGAESGEVRKTLSRVRWLPIVATDFNWETKTHRNSWWSVCFRKSVTCRPRFEINAVRESSLGPKSIRPHPLQPPHRADHQIDELSLAAFRDHLHQNPRPSRNGITAREPISMVS